MSWLDVVIPVHEKDLPVLPKSLRSILRHVMELRQVWVVSERPFESAYERVHWVPEPAPPTLPALAEVEARLAETRPGAERRANWIYQQLVKLSLHEHLPGLSPQYLVIDADVILLRELWFELSPSRRFVFPVAGEHHRPYRDAYERLFGRPPPVDYSLTAHHMLLDRELVAEMLAEIEQRHGKRWFDAYLDAVDGAEASSISEWDTYGWWVLERHPEFAHRRQLYWRDVTSVPGVFGRAMLSDSFSFVAAHAWAKRQRRWQMSSRLYRLALETNAVLRPARHS